ncbi:MAG TPA: universal stress protein [Pseudonocardiaceae bacterium]|nr:universal stress protein [Pseudonocardiaceae bacterium]
MGGSISRIFVGVHGSIGSLHALRSALAEARERDAVLYSVLAWTPPGGDTLDRRVPEPHLRQLWVACAMRELRTAWDDALGGVPDDHPVKLRVDRGDPGWVLSSLADRDDDLIVVGAGRGGRLRRATHRSVVRYCVARAQCRVMVVPPPPLARQFDHRMFRRRHLHDLLNG